MAITVRQFAPSDLPVVRGVLSVCGLAGDVDTSVIGGGVQLVAEKAGRVVGMIQVLPGRPAAYLSYLAVAPEARKSRAAYLLITSAEAELRRLGIDRWLANIANDDPLWKQTVEEWGGRSTPTVTTLYTKKL